MAQVYNKLSVRLNDLYDQRDLEFATLTRLDQDRQTAQDLLAANNNAGAANLMTFMETMYFNTQINTLRGLYDLSMAIGYATLVNAPLNVNGGGLDYATLKLKHGLLQKSLYDASTVGGQLHWFASGRGMSEMHMDKHELYCIYCTARVQALSNLQEWTLGTPNITLPVGNIAKDVWAKLRDGTLKQGERVDIPVTVSPCDRDV